MIRGFFRRSLHHGASRSPLPFLSSPHSILTSKGLKATMWPHPDSLSIYRRQLGETIQKFSKISMGHLCMHRRRSHVICGPSMITRHLPFL